MSASTTSTTALVDAKDLVAGYLPGINILNGCNLYANKGELVGIIGPNGAGKSTLLKALFGLVKVREGQVTLNGETITNMRADQLVARGIGFVPQSNNVFPSLTIEENLQMGAFRPPLSSTSALTSLQIYFQLLAPVAGNALDHSQVASVRWLQWDVR